MAPFWFAHFFVITVITFAHVFRFRMLAASASYRLYSLTLETYVEK